jgi:RNA polymerase sigma-70 factor (ECF subfamily)
MAERAAPLELAQLVAEHHEALYRYAYRLSGSAADAEDLTQQVFLVAQQKLAQIRQPAAARSWLYTVLRHCFLKGRSGRHPLPATNCDLDLSAIAADVDDRTIDGEELRAALATLSDDFRAVVLMFYFEDLSYKEIAAALQLPTGTVMSRLARAKAQLRNRLLAAEEHERLSISPLAPSPAAVHAVGGPAVPRVRGQ